MKQNKCIHHDMKMKKVKKWDLLNAAPERQSSQKQKSFLFLCCLGLLRAGLDLDWLLRLGHLLGLGRLAEEGLAPGVGPAAEVGLPAAEVGLPLKGFERTPKLVTPVSFETNRI